MPTPVGKRSWLVYTVESRQCAVVGVTCWMYCLLALQTVAVQDLDGCSCSIVFFISFPRLAQWLVFSIFLTFTTPIPQISFDMERRPLQDPPPTATTLVPSSLARTSVFGLLSATKLYCHVTVLKIDSFKKWNCVQHFDNRPVSQQRISAADSG